MEMENMLNAHFQE